MCQDHELLTYRNWVRVGAVSCAESWIYLEWEAPTRVGCFALVPSKDPLTGCRGTTCKFFPTPILHRCDVLTFSIQTKCCEEVQLCKLWQILWIPPSVPKTKPQKLIISIRSLSQEYIGSTLDQIKIISDKNNHLERAFPRVGTLLRSQCINPFHPSVTSRRYY